MRCQPKWTRGENVCKPAHQSIYKEALKERDERRMTKKKENVNKQGDRNAEGREEVPRKNGK